MVAVLRVDNQLPLVEKLVGHQNRLVEEAARIAAQVENQLADPLAAQRVERPRQLLVGRPGELPQADVADAVGDAEGRLDTSDGYHVTHHLDRNQVGNSLPAQPQTDLRAARTAQHLDHLLLRNAASGHERVADFEDAVPGPHPRLVARTVGDDVEHDDRIGGHVEDHADAVELTLEGLVERLHLRGGDVDRMGVQFAHEQRDDMLGKRIHRDGVDVLVLDERERIGELVVGEGHVAQHPLDAGFDAVAPHELTHEQPEHHPRGQQQRENHGAFRILVHSSRMQSRPRTVAPSGADSGPRGRNCGFGITCYLFLNV